MPNTLMKHLHCCFWNLQTGPALYVGRGDSCLWDDFRTPRKMSLVKVLCLPPDTTFVFCQAGFPVNCLNFPLYYCEINYFCIIEQLTHSIYSSQTKRWAIASSEFSHMRWVRLICKGFRANSTIWLVLMLTQSKESRWTSAFGSATETHMYRFTCPHAGRPPRLTCFRSRR